MPSSPWRSTESRRLKQGAPVLMHSSTTWTSWPIWWTRSLSSTPGTSRRAGGNRPLPIFQLRAIRCESFGVVHRNSIKIREDANPRNPPRSNELPHQPGRAGGRMPEVEEETPPRSISRRFDQAGVGGHEGIRPPDLPGLLNKGMRKRMEGNDRVPAAHSQQSLLRVLVDQRLGLGSQLRSVDALVAHFLVPDRANAGGGTLPACGFGGVERDDVVAGLLGQ